MVVDKELKKDSSTEGTKIQPSTSMAWNSDISPIDRPVLGKWFCCMMPVITSTTAPKQPDPGLQRLISSLDSLKTRVNGSDLDLCFLKDLLQSEGFQSLMKVHEKVTTPDCQEKNPAETEALQVVCDVCSDFQRSSPDECDELQDILSSPHMRGLLYAHDQIARNHYCPVLPDIPHEVDEDEESVKIIHLVKGMEEPLGATIQLNEQTGAVQIARILHGGAADRCGLINIGDEVHEVNGTNIHGMEPDDIVQMLANALGPITLKLAPGDADFGLLRESKMRVKAHFKYDPSTDNMIPCHEAGLAFDKGDILHIVSQDDPNWWQARKEGDQNMRAGLIPSRTLQERREASAKPKAPESKENSPKTSRTRIARFSPRLKTKSKKTKKIMYRTLQNEDYDSEEVITYEEVEEHRPMQDSFRPIVLIGPPGVGRNELKRRLIAFNPAHFKTTIPNTSRQKKGVEADGEEYIFVARPEMEKDIQNKRYVEYGEYKGNLYGTSVESVKSIITNGNVAVLTPHPQAIKLLKATDYKSFVVFIKPPSLERLKATRLEMKAKSTFDEKHSRPFTEDEFNEMIASSARLENNYSHVIDHVIVNDDLLTAANQLARLASKIETENQWVPASWVR